MGNVQSESTQESETTKDGEEKANPDRSKPKWGPSGTKRETGSLSHGPQTADPKYAGQAQGKEPREGDRQSGGAETGKSNSKKSKLRLSVWAQNLSSGGIKEASRGEKDPVAERRGLACLSRADLRSGQSTGSVLPGEQKGPKAVLKPPQGGASNHGELGTRKEAPKGKSKAENASLGPPPQPEGWMELGPVTLVEEDAAEAKACGTQHIKLSPKEHAEHEGRPSNSGPPTRKQLESVTPCPAPLSEDVAGAPKSLSKRNINRPAPSCGVAPPGGKKVLLSWGSGEKEREKEQVGQQDSAPGSDGDSKSPALLTEHATTSSGPEEMPAASGSDAKAAGEDEAEGAESVSSESVQELLHWGLNFLYKVTIQPGQWPPSIKAVKQKAGLVPPGVSYADILKQCPPKKAATPAISKALHHLTMAIKKLPSFKGLERNNPEDISALRQLFLDHVKEVGLKEPTDQGPNQQVVRFLEELSIANPKRPEWQRPRPPTPYPQHRKGRSRKLPAFDTAVPPVVTFLGSDSKCDWLVQDESQISLDDVAMAVDEAGAAPPEQCSAGDQEPEEVGSPPSIAALLSEQELPEEADRCGQTSWWRLSGPEGGAEETVPPHDLSPLAAVWSSQTEDPPSVLLLAPQPHLPSEAPEPPSPAGSAPCGPARPTPEQKVPAAVEARPKVRKQAPAASKSKEKLKSAGQPKVKVAKVKGQKQRPRSSGVTCPLRLEQVPLFMPFEKVARPFYFGEPMEAPSSPDASEATKQDAAHAQAGPEQDREVLCPAQRRQWPAFQVADACPRKCYCRHQEERKLPKNVAAWLNPSTNHLAEPPWVATALLAVSLVAGTKFCLDSYKQQHPTHED
ncbi:gametogenetin [Sphaerodactylus townsendi]|uniref:Uncharacterized protein n=1 Tax=Sphaerodactylus townsendi TaxID=933632 RepID=A0ACB8FSU5_9SAUR|nr:gametogenetin [Sphaerodactylus townsendi]